MITFWESDNLTSGTLSNLHGMVSTIHIADNNLIEVLNGVEYTLQEFLCIVGIDNNWYLFFFPSYGQRYDFFLYICIMPIEKNNALSDLLEKYIWKIEIPTDLVKAMCFTGIKCVWIIHYYDRKAFSYGHYRLL